MEPEPGGRSKSAPSLKAAILTALFCTLYFFQPSRPTVVFNPPDMKSDPPVLVTRASHAEKKKKKKIYLTFDDGPNKGTRNVRRIVEREEIPVTLFLIGEHVYGSRYQSDEYDSLLVSRFCYLANHSYTHARQKGYEGFYAMPDSVVADFKRCADSLKLTANIVRTPGRNIWRTDSLRFTDIRSSASAADSLFQRGYKILGWDAEWHFDAKGLVQDPCAMLQTIDSLLAGNKTRKPGHLVLLAHDQAFAGSQDSASLHRLINELKMYGDYEMVTAEDYPGLEEEP